MANKEVIASADKKLLAELGYKQEFKRAFTPLEVVIPLPQLSYSLMEARL